MNSFLTNFRLSALITGTILFVGSQKYMGPESSLFMGMISIAIVFFSCLATTTLAFRAKANSHNHEFNNWILRSTWMFSILLSLSLYLLYSHFLPASQQPETLFQKALLSAWIIFGLIGLLTGVGIEWVAGQSGSAHTSESYKTKRVQIFWLKISLILIKKNFWV